MAGILALLIILPISGAMLLVGSVLGFRLASRALTGLLDAKGRGADLFNLTLIPFWIGGELAGGLLAFMAASATPDRGGPGDELAKTLIGGAIGAIAGGAAGSLPLFALALVLPSRPKPKEQHWRDVVEEERGKRKKRRRAEDLEEAFGALATDPAANPDDADQDAKKSKDAVYDPLFQPADDANDAADEAGDEAKRRRKSRPESEPERSGNTAVLAVALVCSLAFFACSGLTLAGFGAWWWWQQAPAPVAIAHEDPRGQDNVAPIAPPAAPKGDAAPKEPLPPNPPPWKPPLNPPPPPEDLPRVKNVALGSPTRKDVMPYPPPIPFGAPRAPDKESRAGPLDQNTKLSLPPGQRMHASNVFKNANLPAGIAKQLQPNQHDGILAAKSSFWSRLEDNVRQRRFVRSALVTGRLGNAYADEWAEPGGLLIGFFASPQGPFLQPIYLTRSGEVVGGAYGNCPNEVLCFKAKAGYAVGGLHIHSGDVFEALSVTYMKVEETGLSRSNWYQSQWMGRDGGTAGFVGHQGHFIVGVQLRLRDTNMTTLGAIFLPPAKTKLN